MHRKGFSLIEVLLIIGILGLLAAIVLAGFNMTRTKARNSAIQSSIVQLRWQAELVYDLQGASYKDWAEHETIQDQLLILLNDINQSHQLPPSAEHVAVVRDGQSKNYCVSAPLRGDEGLHVCIDATGEVQRVTSPCPDLDDEDEEPLRCSDLL